MARVSKPYGRPYRRRKAAAFYPGVPCAICGKGVLTRDQFTLHHSPAVSEGGGPFDEKPAHKTCNTTHGQQLGGTVSSRRRGQEPELPPGRPARRRGGSGLPKQWVGQAAIDFEFTGPARLVYHDGLDVTLRAGERHQRER
jgi:hypothetical protein